MCVPVLRFVVKKRAFDIWRVEAVFVFVFVLFYFVLFFFKVSVCVK